ncbi:MAG: PQQ-dependent sugar dehydrogenase, partial [Cytophagales bacterium]|nr:PQQ-dependent sugar dehydrogenase [Rhizobacter sp.]
PAPPPGGPPPSPPPSPPPGPAGPLRTTVLNGNLSSPWGMVFLPDGRMLVTQKRGSMVIVSADGSTISPPLVGVPAVDTGGQAGLLDVALDPDFSTPGSNWVYFSYSEAGSGGTSGTAVNRGRLDLANNRLTDVAATPIFRQLPKIDLFFGHFGSRLVFRGDKTLFITLGERQQGAPAQDLSHHLGKVVRINRDGSLPAGNPDLGAGAMPEIWSYGHRNPQGAAIHPTTGELWQTEHGPVGGDELNVSRAGQNYGWPVRSYGCTDDLPNCELGGGVHAPQYVEPVSRWPAPGSTGPRQSIAPSGMIFYTGSGFPEWQGNVFIAALANMALWRVVLNGDVEVSRERMLASLGERIRCVKQGPDGWLYLLTDRGQLIRVDR